MSLTEIIKRCQRRVGETDDGIPGLKTWTAIGKALRVNVESDYAWAEPPSTDRVDDQSETNIATLHRLVQPRARQLVNLAAASGITVKVTSGTRTYAAQDALYAKHDGSTKARGGYSNHNFGLAIDLTIFADGKPVWESPKYKSLGLMGKGLGFTWGGDWKSIEDEPHFELHPPWAEGMSEEKMVAELRRRHDNGIDAFA